MELLYISLFLIIILTLHYIYFVGSIYFGLIRLRKNVGLENHTAHKKKTKQLFISIVIPFRNESEVILRNLESIQKLNYPKNLYEVLYIDDFSDDNTIEILKQNNIEQNIKVLQLQDGLANAANKKRAVEYGILAAKGDIIFASDADCTYNPEWITTMLNSIDDKTAFVAGPVDFEFSDSWLGRTQQIEHAGLILSGAGLIGINNPIICSGANIAFRKNVFEKIGGYSGYSDLASGDDSFLMTKMFYDTEYNVKFCYAKNSMVETRANKNVGEFVNQRRRWAGKAFLYKNKRILLHIILLSLFLISLPIQILLGIFVNQCFLYSFLAVFLFKVIIEFLVMNRGTKDLYTPVSMKWFIIAEILHIPYTVSTIFGGVLGNFNWKGRKLKR